MDKITGVGSEQEPWSEETLAQYKEFKVCYVSQEKKILFVCIPGRVLVKPKELGPDFKAPKRIKKTGGIMLAQLMYDAQQKRLCS